MKWLKPPKDILKIQYAEEDNYNPDFIVETKSRALPMRDQAGNRCGDATVQKKAKAAIQWCERASTVSDLPWRYALMPHDTVQINRTFSSLIRNFDRSLHCFDSTFPLVMILREWFSIAIRGEGEPSLSAAADDAGVFRYPSQRVRSFPATPLPESNAEGFLNFFFVQVPPLQAALWQRRSEPVKGLRCAAMNAQRARALD